MEELGGGGGGDGALALSLQGQIPTVNCAAVTKKVTEQSIQPALIQMGKSNSRKSAAAQTHFITLLI